jgi:hypothetical protein
MNRTIHRCRTKATNRENGRIRLSWNWAVARRAELRITSHSIECENWTIPYDEIEDAALVTTPILRHASYILRVKAHGVIYQFGLKSTSLWRSTLDPFWSSELPFAMKREVGHLTGTVGGKRITLARVTFRLLLVTAVLGAFLYIVNCFQRGKL